MFTLLLIVARAAHLAASILISGSFTFNVVALGLPGPAATDDLRKTERYLGRLAVWSLIAALLSGAFWYWLEVVNMSGLSFSGAFSASGWGTVLLKTQFGHVCVFRVALVGVALVLVIWGIAQNEARRLSVSLVLWFLSVLFLISLSWISHAAATRVQPLGLINDAVHLCAVAGWIGGLIPLTIFLAHSGDSSPLSNGVVKAIARFSTLSLCCVSVLIASGICNSWLLVGSVHALFTTTYGWLLFFKLIVFVVLIGFGARNRFLVRSKLLGVPVHSDSFRQLRRNVVREICFGAAVVAIAACLGVTPPARHT